MGKGAIICVDDERITLLRLCDQLNRILEHAYEIELAESGADALDLLIQLEQARVEVPLLICNQTLPDIHGVVLLEQIHQHYPRSLKILLTELTNLDEIAQIVHQTNLYRYIVKPWNELDLELTVRQAIRSYYQDKQLFEHHQALEHANQDLLHEIVERKQIERLLKESEARLASILNSLEEVIWSAKLQRSGPQAEATCIRSEADRVSFEVLYLNPAAEKVYGHPVSDFFKNPTLWHEVIHPEDRDRIPILDQRLLDQGSQCQEYRIIRPDGEVRWLSDRTQVIRDRQGGMQRIDRIIQDITERKRAEERLAYDALHDVLTDLPNRSLFMERVELALHRLRRHPEYQFAVLFIDLDRFKLVNDSLGHLAGDQFLIAIAHRLQKCLRGTDMVARLGGDEFTILVEPLHSAVDATHTAERILAELAMPITLEGHTISSSASIGIVMGSTNYRDGGELLRDADIAMYHAKVTGKAGYTIFDQGMHTQTMRLLQLESDLQLALKQQELSLQYQPIVSLLTGQLLGFEALVRWQHPKQGLISPSEFIPVAEDTGLIVPLGTWVLKAACRQLRQWQLAFPERDGLTISINLAGKQLDEPNLIETIDETLVETQLDGSFLRLELTESMLVNDVETVITTLARLRRRKIQLSIDDFGTGYSSLSYLRRLPVSMLKIDQTFVSRMNSDTENFEIVRAICTLAQSLGLNVVAEGIELVEQIEQLQRLGCQLGQGYWFSRPLDAASAEALIASNQHWTVNMDPTP